MWTISPDYGRARRAVHQTPPKRFLSPNPNLVGARHAITCVWVRFWPGQPKSMLYLILLALHLPALARSFQILRVPRVISSILDLHAEGKTDSSALKERATRGVNVPLNVSIRVANSIDEVNKTQWNGLVANRNPFLEYDWLHCLEQSGCASAPEGWQPLHLIVEKAASPEGEKRENVMVAAVPLYAKYHSYGEFIFDHSWAQFAEQNLGIRYYPKLMSAVPFTPATGPRLLLSQTLLSSQQQQDVSKLLVRFMRNFAKENRLSSANVNFVSEDQLPLFQDGDDTFLLRQSIQYRWSNQRLSAKGNEQKLKDMGLGLTRGRKEEEELGLNKEEKYTDFDDYLLSFKSKRRTQIKRERAKVYTDQGLLVKVISGDDELATPEFYHTMYLLYTTTVTKMWGSCYLSADFFRRLANAPKSFRSKLIFAVAYDPNKVIDQRTNTFRNSGPGKNDIFDKLLDLVGDKDDATHLVSEAKRPVTLHDPATFDYTKFEHIIATTINLVSDTHFFGRYWGAFEFRKHLHFELCYYKSIEFCIEKGLQCMEPGAGGGEFKFLRGFDPFLVNSLHSFTSPLLASAVGDFLEQEREVNKDIKQYLLQQRPGGSTGANSLDA